MIVRLELVLVLGFVACLVLARGLVACVMPPNTPEDYGLELKACLDASKSWEEYEPCCADVAVRHGRDPSFCLRGSHDAGDR
jgi:hypothetical protein